MTAILDPERLPAAVPRRFLPPDADLRDPETIGTWYRRLVERPVASEDDLDRLVLDHSELKAALDELEAILYIEMSCQTDDAEKAEAYTRFIENAQPRIRLEEDRYRRKYVQERDRLPDTTGRYAVYDRTLRSDAALFREENVPLQTDDDLLAQEYQKVCGAMTVEFRGEERTLPQMTKYLLEPDRPLREEAWRARTDRRLQDRDRIDDLYERMIEVRTRLANQAGCRDYVEYKFRQEHRFDYTREDCYRYHEAVEAHVVPVANRILERHRQDLGVDRLRPWDGAVDPFNRPPLKPFDGEEDLLRKAGEAFARTDPEFGAQFAEMADLGLLDLESRKGKAPGGYQASLPEARKPFIFMNAVGADWDVRTLLHEGGHAFHDLATANEPIRLYRTPPIEFCEVASFGMEMLAGDHLSVFYNEDEERRSRWDFFQRKVGLLTWVARVDAFQHWVYTHPGHSREERYQAWIETHRRFDGDVMDWTGLDEARATAWHGQLHIFQFPLYYIEYGIAQLGALQLWVRARQDRAGALADYKRALALGGSRPLPELFEAAGLRFGFSGDTIAPLIASVLEEVDRLA